MLAKFAYRHTKAGRRLVGNESSGDTLARLAEAVHGVLPVVGPAGVAIDEYISRSTRGRAKKSALALNGVREAPVRS